MSVIDKICSGCKEVKNLDAFYKRKNRPNGVSLCKACCSLLAKTEKVKESCKKWNLNNKDKVRRASAKWHKNHPEIIKRIRRKSYLLNIDHQKQAARTWIKNNPARVKITRIAYLENNPDMVNKIEVGLLTSILMRSSILQRDEFKCQLCLKTSQLIMHHIVPKSVSLELVDKPINLITLCKECHLNKAHNGCYRQLDLQIAEHLSQIIKGKYNA